MSRYQEGYDDALAGRPEAPDRHLERYWAGYEQGKIACQMAAHNAACEAAPNGDGPSMRLRRENDRRAAQLEAERRAAAFREGRDESDNTALPTGTVF
jgi:hypothetical protein